MSVFKIRRGSAAVLHKPAAPISQFDGEVRSIARHLRDTLVAHNALGLAAPQIGISKRVAYVQVQGFSAVLINPRILSTEGSTTAVEGCLSLPKSQRAMIRAATIHLEYCNVLGVTQRVKLGGLVARCVQHEIDHLDGNLITTVRFKDAHDRMKAVAERLRQKEASP